MYYVLDSTEKPCRWIDDAPFIKGVKWWHGQLIDQIWPDPLNFTLKPYREYSSDHAQFMPAYFRVKPPLFRDDFIEALKKAGIDNLQTFNAAITDPDNGKVYTNYKAVNIVGLVGAADMDKSIATVHDNIPLMDVDFDRLVIDEKKAHGFYLFRLAESLNTVLIHEKVVNYLKSQGFGDEMHFWEPEQIAT